MVNNNVGGSSLLSATGSFAETMPKGTSSSAAPPIVKPPLVWDWPTEHEDRKKERKADMAMHGSAPFEVDRRLLKDVVREKMGVEAGRIHFLSAGALLRLRVSEDVLLMRTFPISIIAHSIGTFHKVRATASLLPSMSLTFPILSRPTPLLQFKCPIGYRLILSP